ncbi:hypothetical protein DB817_07685 [Xanthomonas perforans]|uniref:Uncharacterized protein n=1 Tax=Xanthomonas perforans TaxID=442694 RepID=A0AAQ1BW04_XANPE|nr:hypothetical protein DB854_17475 [Xanthomonas perforans]RXD53465.1 hypothetical protein DB769_12085 [Xanthomonas perforans]RXD70343.1 hypothetical protein DB766_06290 [Xanthomonas perforans]RXE16739.1 hypothetical protein DB817_07685 [Xanthomonas perforans]RXE19664.1 hypothetical protein DB823_20375 [Xanthomonas perforans]
MTGEGSKHARIFDGSTPRLVLRRPPTEAASPSTALSCQAASPSPAGAKRHGLRATGARVLERPRRKRGPGRRAGVGVRVRAKPRAPDAGRPDHGTRAQTHASTR